MATIYQVSELAGVSLATVSRVINNNSIVSEKTKNKVLSAMKTLDYRPNTMAQSLASNRSNSVGILVSELHGSFYGTMMSDIELALREFGKHAVITAGHSDEKSEKEGVEFLISRSCDALILHVEAVSDDYLIDLKKRNIPFVTVNRYIPEIASNCICLDNELGGYIATHFLLQQGHRDIAYIAGPLWKIDANDRYKGHLRALAEFDVQPHPRLMFEGNFQEEGGQKGVQYLLETGLSFSAIACANDEMAAGAMSALREKGRHIPDDISVMGFDNLIFSRYTYPKLSTINYPISAIGKTAASWVLNNLYIDRKEDIQHLFTPELVVRDSVKKIN
ncbi:LacI family DNA-binding transcriptional regulator [Paraglaciecola sp.]|uniref:LacI family DNA-binding transcriptional regulator n=1 Tax=Paraglaciecola sp. TaxID=1920173 RepID=UPI00273E5ABE|nr:LacI family DNA-binding transcriptional regulator [Paraglaciecola sp.]MDP5032320.1 LacI family DNA-binding transcriptional regulator [Paraglaciecola sp.]